MAFVAHNNVKRDFNQRNGNYISASKVRICDWPVTKQFVLLLFVPVQIILNFLLSVTDEMQLSHCS